MEEMRPAPPGHREERDREHGGEAEEQRVLPAVVRHHRDEEREEGWQHRAHGRGRPRRGGDVGAAPFPEGQGDHGRDREDQEDDERERELLHGEELRDPAPLIERGEDEREDDERREALAVGHVREAQVQDEEVREQAERTVRRSRGARA
jgi:hypothetical protein